MPPMPLEVKILTVALIALLVAAIAVYHVWLDRRRGVDKTTSPPRPTHVQAVPTPTSAAPTPPSGTRPRRAPTRRTR